MKAVLLVGGEGTRLRPLTYYVPKPMVPILNRPFLEHIFAYFKNSGVTEVILTLSYMPDAVKSYFGDGEKAGLKLTYIIEEKPLGTAGAVKNVEKYLDDTFLVLNGDIFTGLNIKEMLAQHRAKCAKASIALHRVENPRAFGVVETAGDNRILDFIEKPTTEHIPSNLINAGTYILEPEVLKRLPAGVHTMFERGLFPLLVELGQAIYGYPSDGYWLDMGNPGKYLRLNFDLLQGKTSSSLVKLKDDGTTIDRTANIHPSATIKAPVLIGPRTVISKDARVEGPVVVGPDCHISEGASLSKAVLWPGINIGAGARLENCVVTTDIAENMHLTNRVVTPDHQSNIT